MNEIKFYVNCIYPAFQGEVNFMGIGAPVIFLRLQGCHLRCYMKTLGTLCDTPEGLSGKEGGTYLTLSEVLMAINSVSKQMGGTNLICLTGGDPLWRKKEDLVWLLQALNDAGYQISIETSGTLSIAPYRHISNVHFVLDYKTGSAGVKQKFIIDEINILDNKDFIKFVIYNLEDYTELKEVLPTLITTKAQIAAGTFWGGPMKNMELYNLLLQDGLLGRVSFNAQLHKMAFFMDAQKEDQIAKVNIPQEI